jgi:IS30 family transposase
LKTKKSKSEIAKTLSVDKSIIYREIKRNYDGRSGEYKAILTQNKYEFRLENNQKLMFSNFCHVVRHFYYLFFSFC